MDLRVKEFANLSMLKHKHGLRTMVERAPEAQEALDALLRRLLPLWVTLYRIRRRIATGSVVVMTVWLFLHIMFGTNGMVVYKQKRAEIQDLQQQVKTLQLENQRFGDQIRNLKTDPRTIEKEAREALHYTRPGEVIYVAPPPINAARPSTDAARK
jgi:cell division protein FtsB